MLHFKALGLGFKISQEKVQSQILLIVGWDINIISQSAFQGCPLLFKELRLLFQVNGLFAVFCSQYRLETFTESRDTHLASECYYGE